MSFCVWAGNKKVSGGALIAKLTTDNDLMLSLFLQVADNPSKKGNFDMQNPVNVKLTEDELGDFIRAINTNGEAKFYHTFESNVTTGGFRYYEVGDGDQKRRGFGLSVTKGEKTVKVGLSLGAAERFGEYLKFCLNKAFESSYQEDLVRETEYQKNRASKVQTKESPAKESGKKAKASAPVSATAPEPVSGGDDIDF